MTNLPLGKDMVIWFATGLSTSKIKDIKKNPNVSVFVDDPDDLTNASITGKAEIVTDARLLKKFWQEPFGFFFPGGPSDPRLLPAQDYPEKGRVPQSRVRCFFKTACVLSLLFNYTRATKKTA